MNFDFLSPRKIVYGWGRRKVLAQLARPLGQHAWLVFGSRTLHSAGLIHEIQGQLLEAGITSHLLGPVLREPEVADVDEMVATVRRCGWQPGRDFVLAIGGGSALDAGKAIAGLLPQPVGDSIQDYLEGVGQKCELSANALPILALPTTAGTGSEVTKNAVISSRNPPFKKSFRSESLMPTAVLVDPELTLYCPPVITARTGMDAITQLLESIISKKRQPMASGLAKSALPGIFNSLAQLAEDPQDRLAREKMAYAALASGLALANSGLGLAHGVAAGLGALIQAPHGLACAMMLPIALRANREIAKEELASCASLVSGKSIIPAIAGDLLADQAAALNEQWGIPAKLRDLGLGKEQIPQLAQLSQGSSMTGNPRVIEIAELIEILESCW